MQEFNLKVPLQSFGARLDAFLADYFAKAGLGLSRTQIQRLIVEGRVNLVGSKEIKPHYKLKPGDRIRVIIEEKKSSLPAAEDIPLDIVYEDEELAVINKNAGLVVHPAPGNLEHTLVNALMHRFKHLSDIDPQRPGIVHRLDKDTSGLLLVAKTNFAHLDLSKQFSAHSIKRKYVALVEGSVEFDENVIELPIGRHPLKRKNMAVGFGLKTRYAKTYYRTLKRFKTFSLLELEPFTGRTHQLRVHLAFIGHPILGDSKYGKNSGFSRLGLHAQSLGFLHPRSAKFLEFSSGIPKEFKDFIGKNKA